MSTNKLFFIFSFLLSSVLHSQSIELPVDYVRIKNHSPNTSLEVIQGSKYLNENFQKGKILFDNKEINTFLRFNILAGEFELKDNSEGGFASIIRSKEIKFMIGSSSFAVYSFVGKGGELTDGYFEILNDGSIQLLKRNVVIYNEAEPAANSYSQAKPARYITSVEYYLSIDKQPAKSISLRKKDILNALDTEEAKSYIKESKSNLKTERDVVLLLSTLNSWQ